MSLADYSNPDAARNVKKLRIALAALRKIKRIGGGWPRIGCASTASEEAEVAAKALKRMGVR